MTLIKRIENTDLSVKVHSIRKIRILCIKQVTELLQSLQLR